MNNPMVHIRRSFAVVSLSVALLLGGGVAWTVASSNRPVLGASRAVTLKVAGPAAVEGSGSLNEGFADIVAPLLPAVVNISTSKVVKNTGGQSPFGDDPFFRQFFGNPTTAAARAARSLNLSLANSANTVSVPAWWSAPTAIS